MPFLAPLGVSVLGALGVMGPATAGAATVAGLATTAAVAGAGYGLYSAGAAAGQEVPSQAPQVSAAPVIPSVAPAPTPVDAKTVAQEEIAKQKRMRLLAGGQTILSSEGPTLSSGAGKTLLGS